MKFFVGVTDNQWFDVVSHIPGIDEVNFWQPSPSSQFQALQQGNLFPFKLHRSKKTGKKDLIAGGSVFYFFSSIPISLALEAVGSKNGAGLNEEMRRQIAAAYCLGAFAEACISRIKLLKS